MAVEWRFSTGQQRNMATKVCERVWEALEELDADTYEPALTEAIQQVREKLVSVLPFGPEDL